MHCLSFVSAIINKGCIRGGGGGGGGQGKQEMSPTPMVQPKFEPLAHGLLLKHRGVSVLAPNAMELTQ